MEVFVIRWMEVTLYYLEEGIFCQAENLLSFCLAFFFTHKILGNKRNTDVSYYVTFTLIQLVDLSTQVSIHSLSASAIMRLSLWKCTYQIPVYHLNKSIQNIYTILDLSKI